jgi:hypothetical protein
VLIGSFDAMIERADSVLIGSIDAMIERADEER